MVSQLRKFLRDNPCFSEMEVYAKKPVADTYQVGQVIKLLHGPREFRFQVRELGTDGRPLALTRVEALATA